VLKGPQRRTSVVMFTMSLVSVADNHAHWLILGTLPYGSMKVVDTLKTDHTTYSKCRGSLLVYEDDRTGPFACSHVGKDQAVE
jgi:hypothetical protein